MPVPLRGRDWGRIFRDWRRQAVRRVRRTGRLIRLERDALFGQRALPRKWVFLVGCYNSGTTLLHDILATHPAIGSMPDEGQFLTDQFPVPRKLGLRRLWALEPERFRLDERGTGVDVERLQRQWTARFNDPTRPVLLEKTPTNAARMRWLQEHFTNAHFIGIVRDGRAVAEGIRRKTGHDIRLAARQWARSNAIMLEDFKYLARARLISYEALTESPAAVIVDLLEFLELPEPPSAMTDRSWRIHEQQSTIRNMNDRSFAALSAEDLAAIDEEAGEMLAQLGYAVESRVNSSIG
jgi:hypothetical protein